MITGFITSHITAADIPVKSHLSVLFTIWLFGFIQSQISSTKDEIGAGGSKVSMRFE